MTPVVLFIKYLKLEKEGEEILFSVFTYYFKKPMAALFEL